MQQKKFFIDGPGSRVVLLGILGGGVRLVLQILTFFQAPEKNVNFYTLLQTWPVKSISFFRPGGAHKTRHTTYTPIITSKTVPD